MDRTLFPYRRERAIRRLSALAPVGRILFVCQANVCRSAYAAASLGLLMVDKRVEIDSAGFTGHDKQPPVLALEAAHDRAVYHDDHRSKLVNWEILGSAEAVFAFEEAHVRRLRRSGVNANRLFLLGDFDTEWTGERAISDPWGGAIRAFRIAFARIDRCLDTVKVTLETASRPKTRAS